MPTYIDYLNRIKTYVKDDASVLSDDDIASALNSALAQFNEDVHYIYFTVLDLGSAQDYIDNFKEGLDEWIEGYSYVNEVYGDGESIKFQIIMDTIYFEKSVQSVTIYYRTARVIVPDLILDDTYFSFNAITLLGASNACLMLSAKFAQSVDATISADAVNYQDKTNKYRMLAEEYKKKYDELVSNSKKDKPASEIFEIDVKNLLGESHLFHSSK